MYEFLANPPWWVVLILSITLAKLWDKLERGVKSLASYCMTHATGKLKRFLMGRKIKQLRNIKATRFSQLSIIRLTIKSYTYLTLFVLCALVALLTAYALQAVIPQHAKILTPALAFIMGTSLLFEVLWLRTSSRVSDLIKHNRKIRKRNTVTTLSPTPEVAARHERRNSIFQTVLDKLSTEPLAAKTVIVSYEPYQKAEAATAALDLSVRGYRVQHLKDEDALMVHRQAPNN